MLSRSGRPTESYVVLRKSRVNFTRRFSFYASFFTRVSRSHARSLILKYGFTGVVGGDTRHAIQLVADREHPFKHPTDNGPKEFISSEIYALVVSRCSRVSHPLPQPAVILFATLFSRL